MYQPKLAVAPCFVLPTTKWLAFCIPRAYVTVLPLLKHASQPQSQVEYCQYLRLISGSYNMIIYCLFLVDEWLAVEKNIQKHCYNVWYESSLLVSNIPDNKPIAPAPGRRSTGSTSINGMDLTVSSLDSRTYRVSNKKLYCYISPKVMWWTLTMW
jgi:hypothetical protein